MMKKGIAEGSGIMFLGATAEPWDNHNCLPGVSHLLLLSGKATLCSSVCQQH